jgi:3-methyladenine DNA glycosylase AlkD
MNEILNAIRNELKKNVDVKTWETSQNFFKEKIIFHGVKTSEVNKISKQYFKELKKRTKAEIFDLCDKLWASGYIEESFIACNFSYYLRNEYEPGDFQVFERWIDDYVNNWASCDTLCNHSLGEFVEMYPEYISNLKQFTNSNNRWKRRAAAVTLIIPARRGKFLPDILDIANLLFNDNDDLVQKGYGWMLKAASQAHQIEIFEYVMKNKKTMPRTSLRYAIEKMPEELKKQAMKRDN